MSTNGKFILAEEATHYLYLDVPDLVAQNILSVVSEARAMTGSGFLPEPSVPGMRCFALIAPSTV